jgi:hypothetical protein
MVDEVLAVLPASQANTAAVMCRLAAGLHWSSTRDWQTKSSRRNRYKQQPQQHAVAPAAAYLL